MLTSVTHGEALDNTTLLIAHGLFGSARNWGVIAKRLSDDRQVIAVDMRNHGTSPNEKTHTYQDLAEDLTGEIQGKFDVLGHSMGGKAAMTLALKYPHKINRLIIADIAPVGYAHSQNHLIDAMEGLDLSQITARSDADKALKTAIPEAAVRAFLLQSLDLKAKKWLLNLPVLRQHMPDIIGFPEIGGQFDGPTLFLSGAASDYVLPEHRAQIKPLFPNAKFAKIPGAGHWLHAEKPREFEAAVRAFLTQ
ncbi:alpha/beta fold hydrolase [Litoreibacter roseus]|uniref:Esterase n=1 Tax=Litoreibacter roseus TaxID=2601869 RepID=A0A6N6JBH1_9RHOB|nr:alpha/beta fold hydrolase [Litoreibacter roseus]GFE63486.1 esterase [Litoreibacter roseus]